jgi:hypothetical protein
LRALTPREKEGEKQVRRMLVLVGLSALLLVVAAGIAVAVTKQCNNIPCRGTANNDELFERSGNRERDRILGLDGEDVIDASTFGRDRDVVEGGRKDDRLSSNDGDGRDTVRGDRGSDICFVDPGDVSSSCQRRGDTDPAALP